MHHAVALCLFAGPGFVLVAVNGVWETLFGAPAIGVPVVEAYTDPKWRPAQAALRDVYRTGRQRSLITERGELRLAPWTFEDGTRGVAARFEPSRAALRARRPRTGAPAPAQAH